MPPPVHQRNDSTLLHISVNVYNQVLSKKCPKIVSVVHVFLCAALLPFSSASGVSPCLTSCHTMSHHVSPCFMFFCTVHYCQQLYITDISVPGCTMFHWTSARSRCRSAVCPICRANGSKRPKACPTWCDADDRCPICKTWILDPRSSKIL